MDWFGKSKREKEYEAERQKRIAKDSQFNSEYLRSVKIATDPGSSKEQLLPALLMLATYGRGSVPGFKRLSIDSRTLNTGYDDKITAAADNIHQMLLSPDREISDAALSALRGLTREFDYAGLYKYHSDFRNTDDDPRTASPEPTQPPQPSDWYKTPQSGSGEPATGESEAPGGLGHQPRSDWFQNK
jgi:hypothetical protein